MAASERARHELYGRLEEVLAEVHTDTLMSHLPPGGWAEVATKQDLQNLEQRLKPQIEALEQRMEGRFEALEFRMQARFEALESQMAARFEALESRMEARISASEARSARALTVQTRVILVSVVVAVVGAILAAPAVG